MSIKNVELKRITRTMHIMFYEVTCRIDGESKYRTRLCNYGPNSDGSDKDSYIGTVEVSYEIPTDDRFYDMRSVELLKIKKEAVIAKSRMEQTRIEAQIQSLMAIEHVDDRGNEP